MSDIEILRVVMLVFAYDHSNHLRYISNLTSIDIRVTLFAVPLPDATH